MTITFITETVGSLFTEMTEELGRVFNSNVLSNFLGLGSLVFAIIIYFEAKKIARRFIVTGIHRSPNLGIEIYQNDKKIPLRNITQESCSVKVSKLKRKPFLISIPKKVFEVHHSGKDDKYVRMRVLKLDDDITKRTYESLTPEEIFLDGKGVADNLFSSNVLFMLPDSHMIMTESRMIEVDDYFYYIYINSFIKYIVVRVSE